MAQLLYIWRNYGATMTHLAQLFLKNFLHRNRFALIYRTFPRHIGRFPDILYFIKTVYIAPLLPFLPHFCPTMTIFAPLFHQTFYDLSENMLCRLWRNYGAIMAHLAQLWRNYGIFGATIS
jgi:hypothetical protein